MHCLDPILGARGGAIGIQFNGRQMGTGASGKSITALPSPAQGSIAEYAPEGTNNVLMFCVSSTGSG